MKNMQHLGLLLFFTTLLIAFVRVQPKIQMLFNMMSSISFPENEFEEQSPRMT